MDKFGLVFDEQFKRHDTGQGHPERPARLDAARAGLESSGALASAVRIEPRRIDPSIAARVHDTAYLERLRKSCEAGRPLIDDPDCPICPASEQIAAFAAGGVCEAARFVARGEITTAFCAVRPPGHHAERDRAMGFCLLNNIALAAETLRAEFGLTRVLIVDWDVHHGNGTQHAFDSTPEVLFISVHADPRSLYPGTGFADETGTGPGRGFTLNVPLPPDASDAELRDVFTGRVLPRAEQFKPEFVLISAGFDAHADDPLGNLSFADDSYRWMTQELLDLADRHAAGRVLSVLEGGYNLDVLRRCVADHVAILSR